MDSLTPLCSALPREDEQSSESISSSFSFVRVNKILQSLSQLQLLNKILRHFTENLPRWKLEKTEHQQTVVTLRQEEQVEQTKLSQGIVETFNSTLTLAETQRRISSIRALETEQPGPSPQGLDILLDQTRQLNEITFQNLRAVIEHFALLLRRKSLVNETIEVLSSRIENAEQRLESGNVEQFILQERISQAVLDLVLEWKHSQEVVEVEKE